MCQQVRLAFNEIGPPIRHFPLLHRNSTCTPAAMSSSSNGSGTPAASAASSSATLTTAGGIVRLTALDDYIAPGMACIKPQPPPPAYAATAAAAKVH